MKICFNSYKGQDRHSFEATGSREVCGFYVSIPIKNQIEDKIEIFLEESIMKKSTMFQFL